MAEQHWIKYYLIDPEDIKDDGTINDDTQLYPYFSNYYSGKAKVEKFNEPITYDQTSNVSQDKQHGYILKDDRTGKEYETGLNRGFSVSGYVKGADNMLWTPAGNDNGYLTIPVNGKDEILIPKQDRLVSFMDNADYNMSYLPLKKHNNGFVTLPTIVTADSDDLVNYYDYIYNGYNPTKVDPHEQMLKKIKYRRLPEDFKYNKQKGLNNDNKYMTQRAKKFVDEIKNNVYYYTHNYTDKENAVYYINSIKYNIDSYLTRDFCPLFKNNIDNICNAIESDDSAKIKEETDKLVDYVNSQIEDFTKNNGDSYSIEYVGDPKSWFPKNLISSDKRLKDIKGSADSDWVDFGDNHKKHIYSDFMKWYNNNCTQHDINCALGDKL